MRGEHLDQLKGVFYSKGSSPHARGARRHTQRVIPNPRIIPACAGSTRAFHRYQPDVRDHPRMRGEHMKVWHRDENVTGSSPHARGARTQNE